MPIVLNLPDEERLSNVKQVYSAFKPTMRPERNDEANVKDVLQSFTNPENLVVDTFSGKFLLIMLGCFFQRAGDLLGIIYIQAV